MFLVMVAVAGLMFATVFAYVAGAPFLLQGRFGLSPQAFGLVFSANAVGMILMTQLNPVLVGRFGPIRVLSVAVLTALAGGLALLVTALTDFGGLLGFMVPLFLVMSSAGLSFPNAPAIALSRHGEAAGTAAAVLGAAQFMIGGSLAPLVGALSDGTAVPLAAIIVGTTGLASGLFWSARRRMLDSTDG
jgi:DHA1 family bicyclomycin/chloramphenicol resistance-like MFS transporter